MHSLSVAVKFIIKFLNKEVIVKLYVYERAIESGLYSLFLATYIIIITNTDKVKITDKNSNRIPNQFPSKIKRTSEDILFLYLTINSY